MYHIISYKEYCYFFDGFLSKAEKITEEEFDKIIIFAMDSLWSLCQKLIPYWKHHLLEKISREENYNYILILLIHHIHKSGGADYYNNVDNFITEAKTGAFSYKIKKDFLDYDNLPTNPMILTMLKNYLRRKGLLQCGI